MITTVEQLIEAGEVRTTEVERSLRARLRTHLMCRSLAERGLRVTFNLEGLHTVHVHEHVEPAMPHPRRLEEDVTCCGTCPWYNGELVDCRKTGKYLYHVRVFEEFDEDCPLPLKEADE